MTTLIYDIQRTPSLRDEILAAYLKHVDDDPEVWAKVVEGIAKNIEQETNNDRP